MRGRERISQRSDGNAEPGEGYMNRIQGNNNRLK